MDIMDEGLLNFWRILNKNNVHYIMVGGFAVNLNGYIRATKDSDLWLKDTIDNRKNLEKRMQNQGMVISLPWKQCSLHPDGPNSILQTE